MISKLFSLLQFVLPKHLLTAFIWRIARIRHVPTKNFLIQKFISMFDVDIDDVADEVPADFATFNDFFVRELADGARPISAAGVVSPVDGTVSAAARIQGDSLIQAKRIYYSLGDLLATELDSAEAYIDGCFATIYLAPFNYHRVHAPLDVTLTAARYVPGDLFSVNQATAESVNGLFRRNERLVLHFETQLGPAALVFVGALNVGSISTPWTGEIRPRKRGVVEALDLSAHPTTLKKGDLLGWFNMGSTVILLLPPEKCDWHSNLEPGKTLRVGETIANLSKTANE